MHRIVYLRWLAPVLAAFLLAGCDVMGSSKKAPPPKSLSHTQFIRQADRACGRVLRQVVRLKTHIALDELEAQDRKVFIPALEHMLVSLHGLVPPRSLTAPYTRLLAALDEVDLDVHRMLDAVDARSLRGVKASAKRAGAVEKRSESLALRLGLRTCARL